MDRMSKPALGLPPTPDILSARRHVSKVPTSDMRGNMHLISAQAKLIELLA
jgi:hypothetical protein